MSAYFAKHAKELQALGYDPVPVGIGKKAIYDTGWQHNDYTDTINDPPLRIGRRGISHRTVTAPAIDIDVLDEGIANQLAVWLDDKGFKSFRYGEKPKFACIGQWPSAPRKKQTSNAYDMKGKECKIEILGDGQQIVMLNRHPNGHDYTWTNHILPVADCPVLTEALVDELFDFFEQAVGDRYLKVGDRSGGGERDTTPNVVDFLPEHTILEHLSRRDPNEGYDDWVTTGMMVYHAGGTFDTWYDWSCNATAYPDPDREELLKKWNSFETDGRKAVFPLDEDMAFDAITSALPLYADSLSKIAKARVEQAVTSKVDSFTDLIGDITPPSWLIKGVVEEQALALFYGPSGSYKSFNVIDMALHIASGTDWQGRRTAEGHVFYFAGEGAAGIRKRVKAWHKFHKKTARFHRPHSPLRLGEAQEVQEWVDVIREICGDEPPKVVIIDTMHSSMRGLDENAAKDISLIFEAAKEVMRILKCSVWLVHHTGKKGLDPRGSSSIEQGVDCRYFVSSETKLHSKMMCYKMKDAEVPEEPIDVIYQDVELGFDEDGDVFGSLVAMPEATSIVEAFIVAHGFNLGSMTAHAIAVLWEHGCELEVSKWSALARERAEGKDGAKRKAFHHAKERLLRKRVISVKKGGNAEKVKLLGVTPSVTPESEGVTE